ncbi:methionyl-tRNA formyltransferase [Lachnospiraceae bacterium A10]|jgi:methionyl-tRNA formyltransferase|nr:methionyl-tRNA formyltransferase [Lachnospiraceae bacterium A10]
MKIIFMGTPDFAVSTVDALKKAGHEIVLVVTQPDKPKGRGNKMQYSDVKVWAVENNIPVYQPKRIREAECVEELKKYEADIAVVAAFGQILPKEILEMPKHGCINVHASLLPKYRGAAPIQWAVLNGDKTTGITIMQMGVGLDDGDILTQREVELAADETGGSLFDRLAVIGGELCVETIDLIAKGEVTPIPQNEEEATHVGMIKKDLGDIDFCEPAEKIERFVRGLNPWPSAYTRYMDKNLKIYRATVYESLDAFLAIPGSHKGETRVESAEPGQVLYADQKHVLVQTGEGLLGLDEIQLEGKKRMQMEDFLRGHKIEAGEMI